MNIKLTIQLQGIPEALTIKVDTLTDLGIRREMWDNLSETGRREELKQAAINYIKVKYDEA